MRQHSLSSQPSRFASPGRPAKSGFTIVEVLVVIAIMAVLTAVIFPVAGKMQQRAIDTKCTGNQREIGRLFPLYAADHNGLYPYVYRANGEDGGIEKWHVDLLAPYVMPEIEEESYQEKYAFREESVFRCPAAKDDLRKRGKKFIQDERLGYGMNESLPGRGPANEKYQAYSQKVPGNVEQPPQTALIMDADKSVVGASSKNAVKPVIGRHAGKVMVLFFDGHNEQREFDDIPFSGGSGPGGDNKANRFWFGTN